MRTRRTITASLVLAGLAATARAQAPAPFRKAAELEALRAAAGSPAMAVAAEKRDTVVRWAVGRRAADDPTPVTEQDRWHLGSITKSMTATLVAAAVEAGAVAWEDTLGGVLGSAVGEIAPAYRAVTFLELLSHRSGLPANLPLAAFGGFARDSADPRAERIAYARLALAQPPVGPARDTFTYSNSGYVLAGAMLELKLGAPWEVLIAERLFARLGPASAGFGAPGTAGALTEPVGHSRALPIGDRRRAHRLGAGITDNPAVLGPAGRAHMRLQDVLTYLAAHRDRAPLLTPASWDRLHAAPFGGDYALGWALRGGRLWHNGSNTLWYAEVAVDRAAGKVAVAAANDGYLERSQPAVATALPRALASV